MNVEILNVEVISDTLELKVDVQFENGSLATYEFPCMEITPNGWQDLTYDGIHLKIIELIEAHKPNWTPEVREAHKRKKEFEYSQMLATDTQPQISDDEINAILASI